MEFYVESNLSCSPYEAEKFLEIVGDEFKSCEVDGNFQVVINKKETSDKKETKEEKNFVQEIR